MAYKRRQVTDGVTVMNKELYDNLQDGIDEMKDTSDLLNQKVELSTSIAKGKNKAKVFSTTESMQEWLSKEENKGLCNIGDNMYIIDTEVPDWWVAEVLDEVDEETGYYYVIAQLETQKVDLTSIEEDIRKLNADLTNVRIYVGDDGNLHFVDSGGADTVLPFSSDEEFRLMIIEALKYSGLNLNENSTWEKITDALEYRFPNTSYDKTSVWSLDEVSAKRTDTDKNYIKRGESNGKPNHVLNCSLNYADGRVGYFETNDIPTNLYSYMRIRGNFKPGKSSVVVTPYVEFNSNEGTLHGFNMPTYGQTYRFDFYTQVSNFLRVSISGSYQQITGAFSVQLSNDIPEEWKENADNKIV